MNGKKLFAAILCLVMLLSSMIPISVMAEDVQPDVTEVEQVEEQETSTEPMGQSTTETRMPETEAETTPELETDPVISEIEAAELEETEQEQVTLPEEDVISEPDTVPEEIENGEEQTEATETETPSAENEAATLFADTGASGSCGDNLTWTLNSSGILTISGNGTMTDYSRQNLPPWDDWKETITEVVLAAGVKSIGAYAFGLCKLSRITIPNGLTSIGKEAFWYCENLSNVQLPSSLREIAASAFTGCGALTGITIPGSVNSIGGDAFTGCSSLKNVTISNGVKSIGTYAFADCGALTGIEIPESVTSIGEGAFYRCSSLPTLSMPSNVTVIENSVFDGCTSLTGISLPGGLKSIGNYAFSGCDKLTGITIPEGTTVIGQGAFYNCVSLTDVTIPGSVTTISNNAFMYCRNLSDITFMRRPPEIGEYSFYEVTADVYYPANQGWTEAKRQNYGGTLTWIETSAGAAFDDVTDPAKYFYEPVYWAVGKGITSGKTSTTFAPYDSCTRAQVMSFLYKAMGSPSVGGSNPFTDVKESDYFYKPVLWAVSQGITKGTTATTFGPYNTCTRAQVMAFLYKAKGSPSVGGSNPFTDVKESDYFYAPVLWAVANGITNGTSATTFGPYNTCTRAQVMTFLYKAMG